MTSERADTIRRWMRKYWNWKNYPENENDYNDCVDAMMACDEELRGELEGDISYA